MLHGGKKSLKLNMVLNAIKGLMSIAFPLISFPYISRVLGVDNIGRFNFANSIISYISLVAGLGISTYAVREGARVRTNNFEFEKFANEMFSIGIFSTTAAYAILGLLLAHVPKIQAYKELLVILSLQVMFQTIGMEWIYSVYENYAYITIRSILFQLFSLVLLFFFVKSENDLNKYAAITLFSSAGANVLNFLHARKYCKVKPISNINWKKHLKPILVLFAMALTVSIYVSSDTTILGFLCDDYTVGIYSVSTKVYTIIKTVLSSVLIVSIPRLSAMLGENDKEGFNAVASDIYCTLLSFVAPAIIGIVMLRKQIVLLISDAQYSAAVSSLSILSIALFFCLGAWFWGQCILVPKKSENVVFMATIVSAVTNIVLNFIFIPMWKENAAALTTVLSEGIAFLVCRHEGKKCTELKGVRSTLVKVIIGCIGIVVVAIALAQVNVGMITYTMLVIILAVLVYFGIEIALNNEIFLGFIIGLKRKIRK